TSASMRRLHRAFWSALSCRLPCGCFRVEAARRVGRGERPQSDRVAKAVENRNAVLPHRAGRPREQISRARLDHERRALPGRTGRAAEARAAGRKQGNANDLVELSLVAMPAAARAGLILIDENLAEGLRRPIEQRRDLAPERFKKLRKRRRLDHRPGAVIIAVAEAHHLTIGEVAVEVERLERQGAKLARERLLLVGGHNIWAVSKPSGKG